MLVCQRLASASSRSGVNLTTQSRVERTTCTVSIVTLGMQLLLHACAYYDPDDKCGPNMVFNEDAHICVCDSDSIKVGGGCDRCPEGKEPAGDKCACPAGMKEDEDGECAKIPGLGDACEESSECEDPVYDYCGKQGDDTAGICTEQCENDGDCDDTYTCADWEATPYCRQFTSVAAACTNDGPDDPACDGDADYCFRGQCYVRGCTPTPDHATDDCPRDRKCCDVSAIVSGVDTACMPLALPAEMCP